MKYFARVFVRRFGSGRTTNRFSRTGGVNSGLGTGGGSHSGASVNGGHSHDTGVGGGGYKGSASSQVEEGDEKNKASSTGPSPGPGVGDVNEEVGWRFSRILITH